MRQNRGNYVYEHRPTCPAAEGIAYTTDSLRRLSAFLALMTYAELVAFTDNLTSVCPVDKDGKTTLDDLRHTIMQHPHVFPKPDPRMEHLAEEAAFVTICLDAAGVPKEEGGNGLSLWGRVQRFADSASKEAHQPSQSDV